MGQYHLFLPTLPPPNTKIINAVKPMKNNKAITMDHVERLSRGKRSGANIGSRSVGHHLHKFERDIYQRALKQGYLTIEERQRANLWHIWQKACTAQQLPFLVLIKQTREGTGVVYKGDNVEFSGLLHTAKQHIKSLL